jgi:hypothetical protein
LKAFKDEDASIDEGTRALDNAVATVAETLGLPQVTEDIGRLLFPAF